MQSFPHYHVPQDLEPHVSFSAMAIVPHDVAVWDMVCVGMASSPIGRDPLCVAYARTSWSYRHVAAE